MPPSQLTAARPIPLSIVDHAGLVIERMVQRFGLPGVPGQFHCHFQDRLDLAQLQEAADRLAARWPLITARLVRSPRPAWMPNGAQRFRVRQQTLDSDSEADLLRAVLQLIADPIDVENEDPVRLTVLHRPGGDDVLTVRGSHIVWDVHGGVLLMRQLLDPTRIPPAFDAAAVPTDPIDEVLVKTPFWKRMKAVYQLARWRWQQQQAPPVTFPEPEKWPTRLSLGRIIRRWIDEKTSAALEDRLNRIGPLANLSLLMAASGFRTMSRYIRGPLAPRSVYEMPLAYNRRFGAQKRLAFQNIVSRITLVARPVELGDRDELVRLLASQMRQKLTEENDLPRWQLAKLVSKLDPWAPRLAELLLLPGARSRSLRVTALPEIFEPGRTALGATFDYCWGNTICPVGVSMDLFKAGRRRLAVFMHGPEALSDEQASQFLDEWLDDLCRP